MGKHQLKPDEQYKIIQDDKWIRLIQFEDKKLGIILLCGLWFWKKWKLVCLGPYGPYPIGISRFTMEYIIRKDYEECVENGYEWCLRGITKN